MTQKVKVLKILYKSRFKYLWLIFYLRLCPKNKNKQKSLKCLKAHECEELTYILSSQAEAPGAELGVSSSTICNDKIKNYIFAKY